jgi:ribosome biogenesis protein Nip4
MTEMIHDFIKKFTDEDLGQIVKIRDSYYLVNDELMSVAGQIKDQPQQIGVYLGEDDHPSLALIDVISKKSDRKLVVDDKGEFLFICGRDLMGQSIKKSNVKEGLVLVQNVHDENLGYGRIIGELNKKDTIVVKNLLDRGDFLRREMRKKQ